MPMPMTANNVFECYDNLTFEIEGRLFVGFEDEVLADPLVQQMRAAVHAFRSLWKLLLAEEGFCSFDGPVGL